MKVNHKPKVADVESSVMELPDWYDTASDLVLANSGNLVNKLSSLSQETIRVRGMSSTQVASDYDEGNLMGSDLYDEPVTLNPSEQMSWARRTTPLDEPDVTDWMVPAKAAVASLKARSREYSRAGSSMIVGVSDPFTPGLNNGPMIFESITGSQVSDNGAASVKFPDSDSIDIPAPGAKSIIKENLLGWGAALDLQDRQWVGALTRVEELSVNPSDEIGFPNIQGITSPLFIGHRPRRPALLNDVSMGFKSNIEQEVKINLRSVSDYTNVLSEVTRTIPKGKSNVNFRLFGLGVPPMVAEITPENESQTILTNYDVRP
jgi:hypothetical protein